MYASAMAHFLNVPNKQSKLELEIFQQRNHQITTGVIRTENKLDWYPIIHGVPCFLTGDLRPNLRDFSNKYDLPLDEDHTKNIRQQEQARTNETFSDKWRRFKRYGMEPTHQEFLYDWYCKKFGVEDIDRLKDIFRNKTKILECGPGSGFNSRFMAQNTNGLVFALDVSDAAFTTYENTMDMENCIVLQADLMETPFRDNYFDLIVADGVLHHTPNTKAAVMALYKKIRPGGEFFFYVYKKMGAVRQFCDEHIRTSFGNLTPEKCYEACESITDLGKALSKLDTKITLSKPIDILGVPAGTHDIQRLFYYNFMKCFWNDAFDYETNNMVNFDWYHPHNAWQHTEEEVVGWLEELGVDEYKFTNANPNGISVFLRKPNC